MAGSVPSRDGEGVAGEQCSQVFGAQRSWRVQEAAAMGRLAQDPFRRPPRLPQLPDPRVPLRLGELAAVLLEDQGVVEEAWPLAASQEVGELDLAAGGG